MKITTNPHSDDYGLSVEIRGHVSRISPATLAARVAEAVEEAARVLVIPPDPDVPVPDDVYAEDPPDCPVEDPSCEGGDGQCHDACEPSAEHAAAMREGKLRARALRLLDDGLDDDEIAVRLNINPALIRSWDDERRAAS